MKFSIEVCSYVSKSPYTYIVVRADEALTKFHVWGNIKAFNTLFYDEKRVLDLVHEKYPDSERIEKKLKSRTKKILSKDELPILRFQICSEKGLQSSSH
jgi:hypothetical protein